MTRSGIAAWILRIAWIVQPLAFVPFLIDACSLLPASGRVLLAVVCWTAWAAALLATFVPSTVSLTVGRLLAPIGPLVVPIAALHGAPVAGWKVAVAACASLLAMLVWFSGDAALALAQGSAYGAEQRFPLKPPVPYLVPMFVSWVVLGAATIGGVMLLANERWIWGSELAVIAALIGWFVGPRFHQLSRRWLVIVPAGVVIHDPVLLAEHVLFRVAAVDALRLAPADTEAADLTGGTAGVAIEIVLLEADTVIKVGGRDQPRGVVLHVTSVLVAPSRPGRALAAAAARHMPVG